jgi:hypothetical protein
LRCRVALVLLAPQSGESSALRQAAEAVGVRWDKDGAFAKAARVRAEIDCGQRVIWQPDARQQRKDALSDAVRALMSSFWTSECPAMPGASDFARKRIAPKEWERHQIHLQWSKTRDLLQLFNTTNHMNISYYPFLEEKPYWIRRGRQGTCMCGKCENTRHGQVACSSNRSTFELAYGTRSEQAVVVAATMHCGLKDMAALSATRSIFAWFLHSWCQQVVVPAVVPGGCDRRQLAAST